MVTKSKVKKEIDKLPDNLLEEVYQFINSVKIQKTNKKRLHSFNLKGQFDKVNIREKAYE